MADGVEHPISMPATRWVRAFVNTINKDDDLEAALALLPGAQVVAVSEEGEVVADSRGVFRSNVSIHRPTIVMRWNGRQRVLFGPPHHRGIYGGLPTMVDGLAAAIYQAIEQGRFSR